MLVLLLTALSSVPVYAHTSRARAQLLAFTGASQEEAALRDATWWARVGNNTYVPPEGLSAHGNQYYYALGSRSALTQEMEDHRVGGDDRWHIFHLPQGPSMLQVSHGLLASSGDRRASLSALRHLQRGTVLSDTFPPYHVKSNYRNPLNSAGQSRENSAVAALTPDLVLSYLKNITSLPDTTMSSEVETRSWRNPAASRATQEYLKEQFRLMGLTPCLQTFEFNGKELSNVVTRVPGKRSDSVVIGAHYDSRPFDGTAPGAEDNGSGLAALLAIARSFAQANVSPEKNVFFVGFAAEEPGLKGSNSFAAELASSGSRIPRECQAAGGSFLQRGSGAKAQHSAIVLDEVGWKSPNLQRPTVNLESFDWAQETRLPVLLDHMAQASHDHNGDAIDVVHSNHPFGSDHMSFLDRGIPAVLAINGDDEKYPNYHSSADTLPNVSPEYAAQISRMVLGAAMRMAGAA